MTAADLLEVYGTFDESTTINLLDDVGGWNLMGYPSASSELLPDALDSIDGVYTLVYANHAADTADLWKMFDPSAPGYVNDLLELAPGWGYWIFVNSDAELEVTY